MSSVLAKIFNQAEITFSIRNSDAYKQNFMLLKKLVDSLVFSDLNLNPILFSKAAFQVKNKAPCTFINLYEKQNSTFSMSIFIMNGNYKMPLHDHPNMCGLLRVISGQIKVESYTRIKSDIEDEILVKAEEPKILDELSASAVLFPENSNFHEITALNEPAAFFDILAPPYSDYNDSMEPGSRHCSFYKKIMFENCGKSPILKLVKIDVPDHYYCDSVAYKQPDFMR
ncbi:hypothetical protein PVAND_006831 [Polypedilum vanderplanki]|uniref:2-aminoethanethiol dioxygenase n=1 Tax=Polypedilum vanderplanki TaxID=319348 RepID=A0A9J6C4X7_POLVA|nr:hypothetical protein PVAND_006831 [Polypedilum vanderplanki]